MNGFLLVCMCLHVIFMVEFAASQTTECVANGITGVCIDVNDCTGTNTSGLCPGGSNIQCCTDNICSIPGVGTGVCRNPDECGGSVYSGYCVGSSAIQCCFNHMPNPSEFRGAWVASVANVDWPSRPGLTTSQQQSELLLILDMLVDLNMNAIMFQIRPEGDAMYDGEEPWSAYLTGTQGTAPNPYWDPLQFAVTEAHSRGIQLHAWFNPYRAALSRSSTQHSTHMCRRWPEYCYSYGANLRWMDPGAEELADHTFGVMMDVLTRYNVDGIHIDDYFYPYPESGYTFPDDDTYSNYRNNGGNLTRDDWRRDNVNRLVKRIYDGVRSRRPEALFSVSPFGIYRPGEPPGIVGFDQYEGLFADPKKWLQEGWVDVMMPQLYWQIDPPQQSYDDLLEWWSDADINRHNAIIIPGNALYQLGTSSSWNLNEFGRQIVITRDMYDRNVLGNCFFSMSQFLDNLLGVRDWIERDYYNEIVPIFPFANNSISINIESN